MKVVFLDFWGVMDGPIDKSSWGLDPRCGALVNDLCRRTGAVVVIISDAVKRWPKQTTGPFPEARDMLTEAGVTASVVGCTYQLQSSIPLRDRGQEIRVWLDGHPDVISYVILDDKPLEGLGKLAAHFVQVDGKAGLTSVDTQKAVEILNG